MVIDFDTQQLAEQITLLKASNGEMFTVHDVTRAVRAQVGRSINVPHEDVKIVVHGVFERGSLGTDYTRHLANFPGVSPLPWIYHRITDDHTTYRTPSTALPPNPLQGLSLDAGTVDDEMCRVDARETLCIPARYVRGIGLDTGDTAYVYGDFIQNCVLVGKEPPPADYAEYSVDRNGNVRVTQGTLTRFAQSGAEYKVALNSGTVKVVRHS